MLTVSPTTTRRLSGRPNGWPTLMLPRRLLWQQSGGSLIVPAWSGKPDPDRIHYPIQFFDVLR